MLPRTYTFATRRACAVLILALWSVCSTSYRLGAQQTHSPRPPCPFEGGLRKQIGSDSIGHLPLWLNVGTLRSLCPNARDTTVSEGEGQGARKYPGVVLSDGELTAIALQFGNDSLDAKRPADGWIAQGKGADLPSQVPIEATWEEIYRKYPVAQAQAGSVLVVRFCSFSSALITLQIAPGSVPIVDGRVDLARIPVGVTIHHLVILSQTLARGLGTCP